MWQHSSVNFFLTYTPRRYSFLHTPLVDIPMRPIVPVTLHTHLQRKAASKSDVLGGDHDEKLDELVSQLDLVRDEIFDDQLKSGFKQGLISERVEDCRRSNLLDLSSQIQLQAVQLQINPAHIEQICDQLTSLPEDSNHDMTQQNEGEDILGSSMARRLINLSTQLRKLSEGVLGKHRAEKSVSGLSEATGATSPSYTSDESSHGSDGVEKSQGEPETEANESFDSQNAGGNLLEVESEETPVDEHDKCPDGDLPSKNIEASPPSRGESLGDEAEMKVNKPCDSKDGRENVPEQKPVLSATKHNDSSMNDGNPSSETKENPRCRAEISQKEPEAENLANMKSQKEPEGENLTNMKSLEIPTDYIGDSDRDNNPSTETNENLPGQSDITGKESNPEPQDQNEWKRYDEGISTTNLEDVPHQEGRYHLEVTDLPAVEENCQSDDDSRKTLFYESESREEAPALSISSRRDPEQLNAQDEIAYFFTETITAQLAEDASTDLHCHANPEPNLIDSTLSVAIQKSKKVEPSLQGIPDILSENERVKDKDSAAQTPIARTIEQDKRYTEEKPPMLSTVSNLVDEPKEISPTKLSRRTPNKVQRNQSEELHQSSNTAPDSSSRMLRIEKQKVRRRESHQRNPESKSGTTEVVSDDLKEEVPTTKHSRVTRLNSERQEMTRDHVKHTCKDIRMYAEGHKHVRQGRSPSSSLSKDIRKKQIDRMLAERVGLERAAGTPSLAAERTPKLANSHLLAVQAGIRRAKAAEMIPSEHSLEAAYQKRREEKGLADNCGIKDPSRPRLREASKYRSTKDGANDVERMRLKREGIASRSLEQRETDQSERRCVLKKKQKAIATSEKQKVHRPETQIVERNERVGSNIAAKPASPTDQRTKLSSRKQADGPMDTTTRTKRLERKTASRPSRS